MFASWAEQDPELCAVLDQKDALSYGRLAELSGVVAQDLPAVKPDDIFGLVGTRGLEMVVGLMGIIASGAAFVPVDPTWPAQRTRHVMERAGARAVVGAIDPGSLPPGVETIQVDLDAPKSLATAGGTINPLDLAYVLFTSGSTGAPKGVMVEHRALAAYLRWAIHHFCLKPGDRMLQFARLTFDASVGEIFGALATGATLCLVDEDTATSPPKLAAALDELEITHFDIVPSVLSLLPPEAGRRLKYCMSGGEAVPLSVARDWSGRGRTFVNGYGPAEATVISVASSFNSPPTEAPPIGKPLPDLQAYVLDDGLEPVAQGAIGSLYLGGIALARGYLGDPAETAKRFLPDPFSDIAGARMYDTGDMVRLRDDAQLAFVGRRDRQVKIAGQRVEPEEIEAILRHEVQEIVDCAVVPWRDDARRVRLVFHWSGDVELGEIRAAATRLLPRHMVPSLYRRHEHLPLNSSGKVDRATLTPPTVQTRPSCDVRRGKPHGLFMRAVAEVLPVEPEEDRSFAELGGDSLDAMRVLSRLPQGMALTLSVRDLLSRTSLRELSNGLSTAERPAVGGALAEAGVGPWPMTWAQQGIWLAQRRAPTNSAYNIGVAIELSSKVSTDQLELGIEALAERHPILSRSASFENGEPRLIQGPRVPALDELHLSKNELSQELVRASLSRPFDLDGDPLFRPLLFTNDEGPKALLLTVHHLVADGWSLEILVDDLHHLLTEANRQESRMPVPATALSTCSYAAWEKSLADGGYFEDHLAELAAALRDMPRALELDNSPGPVRPDHEPAADFNVSLAQGKAIARVASALDASPFMVLLALFARALRAHSGRDRMIVGCPVALRPHPDLEQVVGHFVNVVPIPLRLGEDLQADLQMTRNACLEAFEHRLVPFPMLVRQLGISPKDEAQPLVQVIFQVDRVLRQRQQNSLFDQVWDRLTPFDAGYTLALRLLEEGSRYKGIVQHEPELVGHATVGEIATCFQRELAAFQERSPDVKG